jgi:Protein of unknown function (DUF4239)
MPWIESQPPEIISLIIFGFSYAVVVLLLLASAVLARRPIGADLKATSPVMLTPLSVIVGLLIAFLAARVWNNLDRASSYVAQEASSVRESIVLADELPPDVRAALRQSIRLYLQFVESNDWPAMTAGRADLKQTPEGLAEAVHAALSFDPAGRSQRLAQQQMMNALARTLEARRYRILLSEASISPLQWVVIIILDILILVTIAMVHLERRRTAAINMLSFATGIAACLTLLMVHDRPFSAGGFTLEPAALRTIAVPD